MSTLVEFWCADGNGEALIHDRRCKVMDAIAFAATTRPTNCVLVTLRDTRKVQNAHKETVLWKKPGYSSSCVGINDQGCLNIWKQFI